MAPQSVRDALAQIAALPETHPVLVSITIGANDLEFGNVFKLIRRLAESDDDFYSWADSTLAVVESALERDIRRLLVRPNVAVVVTEYHNPFNAESWFFMPRYLTA